MDRDYIRGIRLWTNDAGLVGENWVDETDYGKIQRIAYTLAFSYFGILIIVALFMFRQRSLY